MAKLRIKFGAIEIDYEGETEFSGADITAFFDQLSAAKVIAAVEPDAETTVQSSGGEAKSKLQMHTNSIAAKLGVKTGPDLALASAAHLQIVKGVAVFDRKALVADMKSCPGRYKESYLSNLSKTIDGLVKSHKFNQLSADSFSLSDETRQEIESKIAA